MPSYLAKPVGFQTTRQGHPLSNGLVAGWALWEGSGNSEATGFRSVTQDLSNTQATASVQRAAGTVANLPQWVSGPYGHEMSFDGSNSYLRSDNSYDIANIFSIGAVFSTSATGARDILRRDPQSGSRTGIILRQSSTSKIQMEVFDTSVVPLDVTSTNGYNDGLYHIAVCTYNRISGAGVLYVDGVQVATGSKTLNSLSNPTIPWTIGVALATNSTTSEFWSGRISGVFMWNRVLSADDVKSFTFDPFSMFRRRSKWWETIPPTVATGIDDDLIPMTGGGILVPVGMGAAAALYRNRKIDRRAFLSLIGWNRED